MFMRVAMKRKFIAFVLIVYVSFRSCVELKPDEMYFRLPLQNHPAFAWCKELRSISEPRNPVVLISAPGSGNTWLRYLLQQATGIATGSIYGETFLYNNGFPGETCKNGSVLVVKSHSEIESTLLSVSFDSAVLLIRKPRDSILASFHYEYASNNDMYSTESEDVNRYNAVVPPSAFNKSRYWPDFAASFRKRWIMLYTDWLTNYRGPIHVVFYEKLVNDPEKELRAILDFLNFTVTRGDVECAIERRNDFDDIYRRPKKYKYFDPFTKDMYKDLELAEKIVYGIVNNGQ